MLGVVPPSDFWNSESARFLEESSSNLKNDSVMVWYSDLISRAILTLERLSSADASVHRHAGVFVKQLRETISNPNLHDLRQLELPERKLRRLISGKSNSDYSSFELRIRGYSVSEKCLGGCTETCALGATGSDPQMPWGLFDAVTSHPDILSDIFCPVHLGDGEALLYNQNGRKLFDVVDRLVRVCGYAAEITTPGLIPQNRELGLEFLRSLEKLGAYSSDFSIYLSFNLYFGFIRNENDIRRYIQCVLETIEAISRTNCKLYCIVMSDASNEAQTDAAYSQVEPALLAYPSFKAPDKFQGGKRNPNAIGFAVGSPKANDISECGCYRNDCERDVILRPDGSLSPFCSYFGHRGSRIGNVLENDGRQLSQLFKEHERRFESEIRHGKDTCLNHQRWGERGVFTAPKSDRPLVRLRC